MDGNLTKIGPAGTEVGNRWDEKGHTKIVQIFVYHDDSGINSIQFMYVDQHGALVQSDRHGSKKVGNKFHAVKINYPDESITQIFGRRSYQNQLYSIGFGTNRGQYGPFGLPNRSCSVEFSYDVGNGQFGGFFGTAHHCGGVTSIGVYLKTIMPSDIGAVRRRMLLERRGRV